MDNYIINSYDYDESFNPFDELPEGSTLEVLPRGIELIKEDYNLNSPLLRDDLNHINQILKNPTGFKKDSLVDRRTYESLRYVSLNEPKDWSIYHFGDGFHSWVSVNIYQGNAEMKDSIILFKNLDRNIETTDEVTSAFWKSCMGESLSQNDRNKNMLHLIMGKSSGTNKLSNDVEWFWLFHKIILIMNSTTDQERVNLKKNIPELDIYTGSGFGSFYCTWTTKLLGEIIICPGVLIINSHKQILSRNMTLMIKDTMIGRFASKISVINRSDKKYPEDSLSRLEKLYYEGDKILEFTDNFAYDRIKILEPLCNYRLTQLARLNRPLIPQFTKFWEHLLETKNNLENEHPVNLDSFFNVVMDENSVQMITVFFSSYRHWGHPFIDYLEGLKKLNDQVTLRKYIDKEYAEVLASDLAYIVLHKQFKKYKKWFIDPTKIQNDHILYEHIINTTWPTPKQIEDMGDSWHLLPLIQCFKVPETVDPSVMYSDKSHSMDLDKVKAHIKSGSSRPIPSVKVLKTVLENPNLNLQKFLNDIDTNGFDFNSLLIGLKGKERELKRIGRFFALLSWTLREYFVSTEFLIKEHFVPLFEGLTMADDLTTLVKKLLDNSIGQGSVGYEKICIANHIDYDKWNNHQREESTLPVFKVMDKFLGFENVISRTHEIFQNSLIYYNDRPDLMRVVGNQVENKSIDKLVCWQGQFGGLEGLRQKGWSIISLLMILRESKHRNTEIKVLAQGDNQVICTKYNLTGAKGFDELIPKIQSIIQNNEAIMANIVKGTNKLGLIINNSETIQSADYLVYGKIPLYRGNILSLEQKKWSRITCSTNDQVPSLSNVMATISTSVLGVSHFSESLKDPILLYNWFSCFCLNVLVFHNPLTQGPIHLIKESDTHDKRKEILIRTLYLDPSLGGTTGTSMTRFLIRTFPDPVCESLTFWKGIYEHTLDKIIQKVACEAGSPILDPPTSENFAKLLERPTSLNLPKGLSAQMLLKNAVREALENAGGTIVNKLVSVAVRNFKSRNDEIDRFLYSIRPLFPRFLSEFKSATFIGITESIVNLFQNSRTLRNLFRNKFTTKIGELMIQCEGMNISVNRGHRYSGPGNIMWNCSSEHADRLRDRSWGSTVYGATVPHPLEFFGSPYENLYGCIGCNHGVYYKSYLSLSYPGGLCFDINQKGTIQAYLGSKTKETTSLFSPWEKTTEVPILRKACRLRETIGWFVKDKSLLSDSIMANLKSLTGFSWKEDIGQYQRTGTSLHRFKGARQSNGGFISTAPNLYTYVLATTDNMSDFRDDNYDFMYQALLLYGQLCSVEKNRDSKIGIINHHMHIHCDSCVRKVIDISLDTDSRYSPPDFSDVVKDMSGMELNPLNLDIQVDIPKGNWTSVSWYEKSYHVGRTQALVFSILWLDSKLNDYDNTIFPLNMFSKVSPSHYIIGILGGIKLGSYYNIIYHRDSLRGKLYSILEGAMINLYRALATFPEFQSLMSQENFSSIIHRCNHKIPPTYPLSDIDRGEIIKSFLFETNKNKHEESSMIRPWIHKFWIFADLQNSFWTGLILSIRQISKFFYSQTLSSKQIKSLKLYKQYISMLHSMDGNLPFSSVSAVKLMSPSFTKSCLMCSDEIRYAIKFIQKDVLINKDQFLYWFHPATDWKQEFSPDVNVFEVSFESNCKSVSTRNVKRISNPLISGLRIHQFATGAHLKIRGLYQLLPVIMDAIVGGDGSGGVSASILRYSKRTKVIYNSRLIVEGTSIRGTKPSPPSAINFMSQDVKDRCVNLETCWESPNDLSLESTWEYFENQIRMHKLEVNLIILDMEIINDITQSYIEKLLSIYQHRILNKGGNIIFKTYFNRINTNTETIIDMMGKYFRSVLITNTELTSFGSSELYIIFKHKLEKPDILHWFSRNELINIRNMCKASKTIKEEFKRSLNIKISELSKGIPQSFHVRSHHEVINILTSLGVEPGLSSRLGYDLIYVAPDEVSVISIIFLILTIVCNKHIDICYRSKTKIYLQSDPRINKMLSFLMGTWLFLSWKTGDYGIFRQIHIFLQEGVIVVLKNVPLKLKEKKHAMKHNKFGQRWYLRRLCTGEFINSKTFTDFHLSSMGSVVRMWTRGTQSLTFSSNNIVSGLKLLNARLMEYNIGLNLKRIRSRSDILFPICNPNREDDEEMYEDDYLENIDIEDPSIGVFEETAWIGEH